MERVTREVEARIVEFRRALTLHFRERATRLGEESVALLFGVEPSSEDRFPMEIAGVMGSVGWSMLVSLLAGSIPGVALASDFSAQAPEKFLRGLLAAAPRLAGAKPALQ